MKKNGWIVVLILVSIMIVGIVYNKKEEGKAIRECSKIIELNPKSAIAYSNRGIVYLEKEDYEKEFIR